MGWTKQQQRAIDERDKSILVSAAAGSGKTAVMVERVCKMITDEGIPIDRMLIVTFTNAAAAEMREKIRRMLKDRAAEDGRFTRQLDLLPSADICTFHSFAINVIRRFFYMTDLEPDFSVADESRTDILKEEAMDELFDSLFMVDEQVDGSTEVTEEEYDQFCDFMDRYGDEKTEKAVRNMVSNIYRVLSSLPDRMDVFRQFVEDFNSSEEDYLNSNAMEFLWQVIEEDVSDMQQSVRRAIGITDDNGIESIGKVFLTAAEDISYISQAVKERDFDETGRLLGQFKFGRMVAVKADKEVYAMVKAQIVGIRDRVKKIAELMYENFFIGTLETQIKIMQRVYPQARTLYRMVNRYHEIFMKKKHEQNIIDFNDIEHYCLSILRNEEASGYYKRRYKNIFIDEYQDTSILQEAIIGCVARDDNLFMVGDIKQSIYKFRLAEPEIFKTKYYDFDRSSVDEPKLKIDLNRNFRSKSTILEGINKVFQGIMEDYDENAALYPGLSYIGDHLFHPELRIIDKKAIKESENSQLLSMDRAEIEALEVAEIIKENVGKSYYDSKAGCDKILRYSDIVILMRSVSSRAETYMQVMKSEGIPFFTSTDDGYFEQIEIEVFMNLLSVIDNRFQDVPMISVLRSEIFGFSPDDLAEIRDFNKKGSYVDAFVVYSKEGSDKELKERVGTVIEKLVEWKKLSKALPLDEFLWALLNESGYYILVGAMPNGARRQANLRILVDRASVFSEGSRTSLYGFMKYVEVMKKKKLSRGQAVIAAENEDVVRIMTIHKSKGLEFPMVIIGGMGNRLTYTKPGQIIFHKDIGLGMSFVNKEANLSVKTLWMNIIGEKIKREEAEEQIRVLYVAMTRAKEKLYMVGTVDDYEKFADEKEYGITGKMSFLDMMDNLPITRVVDPGSLIRDEVALDEDGTRDDLFNSEPSEEVCNEVRRRLDYRYPYEKAKGLRSKYSVSMLNNIERRRTAAIREIESITPTFVGGDTGISAAEKGTAYHRFMEKLDFTRAYDEGVSYIEEFLDNLVSSGIMTEIEADIIDISRIVTFFKTEIGIRAVEADRRGSLFKEEAFTMKMGIEGETVLVQGVIDCFFEEEDGVVLLDYKTNYIDLNKGIDEEKMRISDMYNEQMIMYSRALEGAGVQVKEALLYLVNIGEFIDIKGFSNPMEG